MTRGIALGTGLVALLATWCAPAAAEPSEPGVVAAPGHATTAAARSVAAYWTPARMREATRNSGEQASGALAWSAGAGAPKPAPAHLPGMKAIGRVFSVKPDGQPWSCSGTLVDSRNRSVVWTAGHCIHTGRGGAFHTQLAFAPGYQPQATGNPTPYGIWPAFGSAATGSWVNRGISVRGRRVWKTGQYDLAGLVLARDGAGRPAIDAIGAAQHIRFRVRKSRSVRMIGYPLAPPYGGETLMQCGPSRLRTRPFAVNLLMIPCTLTHGMSGGPALVKVDAAGVGTVIGEMTVTDDRRMFMAFQGIESRRLYRYLSDSLN